MTGVEASNITDIAFWIASALAIAAALLVVTLRDIFRAALFLALSFLAVAGIFVLLRAEFLAVVQVLIYVGAISILVIFAIMLVRDVPGGNTDNGMYAIAGTIAALLAAAVIERSGVHLGVSRQPRMAANRDLDQSRRRPGFDADFQHLLVGTQFNGHQLAPDPPRKLVEGRDQRCQPPGIDVELRRVDSPGGQFVGIQRHRGEFSGEPIFEPSEYDRLYVLTGVGTGRVETEIRRFGARYDASGG